MLLALDAGNTNITLGVFVGDSILARWRIRTVPDQTADEWGVLIGNLFELSKLEMRLARELYLTARFDRDVSLARPDCAGEDLAFP